jgi:polysaccharide deacetylase 2 family uncharacterized protein YibQ
MITSHIVFVRKEYPHQKTYKVLKEELPKIKASVRLVPASSIVRIIGP